MYSAVLYNIVQVYRSPIYTSIFREHQTQEMSANQQKFLPSTILVQMYMPFMCPTATTSKNEVLKCKTLNECSDLYTGNH